MNKIVSLTGEVKFTITLDPSVWIFDDRKMELEGFFINDDQPIEKKQESSEERTEPVRHLGKPPVKDRVKRFRKEQLLSESFVIPVKPFIENAEPLDSARTVTFELIDGSIYDLSLEKAKQGVFAFSEKGKALSNDGPIHFYFGDGSNRREPVKGIQKIVVG